MSNIDKQAQYESKFSRLWERYDEASHGNAEQMRDILEVTLDALESAERQILRLEKLAEAESVGADKAAASGVEWMKRCQAAEKLIAELEAREVVLPSVQDVHPLGPQSAKIFCEFHRSIVNRCADEIRKVGVKVSIKGA
ncbi:ead/Ea22-like family protein [Enterobacter roggenkampii]|uniref:ead/Ea22-like family protein n=1 Tax=Enterobacter roggenkampii TaxID=1812935 RepID=UPI000AC82693|nr:ead/Ea22-like family protein [Enterobacter roggenkampii]